MSIGLTMAKQIYALCSKRSHLLVFLPAIFSVYECYPSYNTYESTTNASPYGRTPDHAYGRTPDASPYGRTPDHAYGRTPDAPPYGSPSNASPYGRTPIPAYGSSSNAPPYGRTPTPAYGSSSNASPYGRSPNPAYGNNPNSHEYGDYSAFASDSETPQMRKMNKKFANYARAGGFSDSFNSDSLECSMVEAAMQNDLIMCKRLLGSGIDIDDIDKNGHTALYYAVVLGHAGIVQVLLDSGASLYRGLSEDVSLVSLAKENNYRFIADILKKHGEKKDALFRAAKKGDNKKFLKLTKDGDFVNFSENDAGETLVHVCDKGYFEIAYYLINYGVDVHYEDCYGRTPLYTAAANGHLKIVRSLLESGAVIDQHNIQGCTPLCIAAKSGHYDVVCELLYGGASPHSKHFDDETLLIKLCRNKPPDVAKICERILEKGANVNETNPNNLTPLYFAVEAKKKKLSFVLRKYGADLTKKMLLDFGLLSEGHRKLLKKLELQKPISRSSGGLLFTDRAYGNIPYSRSQQSGSSSSTDSPYQAGSPFRTVVDFPPQPMQRYETIPLQNANDENFSDRKTFREYGDYQFGSSYPAPVNDFSQPNYDTILVPPVPESVTKEKSSSPSIADDPIENAIFDGNLSRVEELIQGESPDKRVTIKDQTGEKFFLKGVSYLHVACYYGHLNIVMMLLSQGFNIKDCSTEGNTPLHYAVEGHGLDVLRELINRGVTIDCTNTEGETPLFVATKNEFLEIVKVLLYENANPNIGTISGVTPLSMACIRGNFYIVEELLDQGALADGIGNNQETPLTIASRFEANDNAGIVKLLLSHDASKEDLKRAINLPLTEACKHNYLDKVRVLLKAGISADGVKGSGEPLFHAAKLGFLPIVAELLKYSPTLDFRKLEGLTIQEMGALGVASMNGHADVVRALLVASAPESQTHSDGGTPLHCAARSGHVDVVKELISHCADTCHKDYAGYTARYYAYQNCYPDVADELMKAEVRQNKYDASSNQHDQPYTLSYTSTSRNAKGDIYLVNKSADQSEADELLDNILAGGSEMQSEADDFLDRLLDEESEIQSEEIDSLNAGESFESSLVSAIANGNESEVKKCIATGANLDFLINDETPLIKAIKTKNVSLVSLLLSGGAWPHILNKRNETALFYACRSQDIALVRALLDADAQVDQISRSGLSPLHIACVRGLVNIARELLNRGAAIDGYGNSKDTPLVKAARFGEIEVVRLLLAQNVSIEGFDDRNNAALETACNKNYLVIVQELIRGGVLIDGINDDGAPLFKACQNGFTQVVDELLKHDVSLSKYFQHSDAHIGETALYIACKNGYEEIVNRLLNKGAQVNQALSNGMSPLLIACTKGHAAIVALLLQRGAEINAQKRGGKCALFVACEGGHTDCVKKLLEYNPSTDLTDDRGDTPLHIAVYHYHRDIVALLLEKGVSIDKVNNEGLSPFALVGTGDFESIRELLRKYVAKKDDTQTQISDQQKAQYNLIPNVHLFGVPRYDSVPKGKNDEQTIEIPYRPLPAAPVSSSPHDDSEKDDNMVKQPTSEQSSSQDVKNDQVATSWKSARRSKRILGTIRQKSALSSVLGSIDIENLQVHNFESVDLGKLSSTLGSPRASTVEPDLNDDGE